MSYLEQKLTAQSGGESVVFLNDIVAQLWPNINVAGSKMIKDIADPMFKTMLPGPLASLHFTKVDLGKVPIRFSNALTSKTERDGIKLDLNVEWDGNVDIQLDGEMVPTVGVNGVKLWGRLSVLLCPLTNVIPLIGAAQVAFVNPPELELKFSGAADIANISMISGYIRKVIITIINSMAVLPNRFLVKLDTNNDYFNTVLYPLGVIRVTVEKASGFAEEAKSSTKKFFSKLTRASPDCYANVSVGAEEVWKTSVKSNTTTPTWNETHDFIVNDFDQCLLIDVKDQDVGEDKDVGMVVTTVKDILKGGGRQELAMVEKGTETGGKVSVACEFFKFDSDSATLSASSSNAKGAGQVSGLAIILVAGALSIKGQREQLTPSVVVKYGEKHHFQTAKITDAPGVDINNPAFDTSFRILLTPDLTESPFRIALMNGDKEIGSVDVPYADVVKAPNMTLQNKFDVGGGTTVRASICLLGLRAAQMQEALPLR